MKIKSILLLLLLGYSIKNSAQDFELFIMFSSRDCINCTIALNSLSTLNNNINIKIILNENERNYFEEFSQNMDGLRNCPNLLILYSDSIYDKYIGNNQLSSCILFKGGQEIFSFLLKEFFSNVNKINILTHEFKLDENLFTKLDSINFSERIQVFRFDEMLLFYDYLLNKIVYRKINQIPETGRFHTIKGNNIDKKLLLRLIEYDTMQYNRLFPVLKQLNKEKVRIENIYYHRDTLYTMLSLSYPYEKGSDTIIDNYLYIGIFTNNSEPKFYFIEDQEFSKQFKYYIDNTAPFYTIDKTFHFSISSDETDTNKNIFTSWVISESKIKFIKFDTLEIPQELFINSDLLDASSYILRDGLFYFNSYPFAFSIHTNKAYDMGNIFEKMEGTQLYKDSKIGNFKIFIQDMKQDDDLISILYFMNKTPKIAYYDIRMKKILMTKEVIYRDNFYAPTFNFINSKNILVLDKKRKKIYYLN